MFSIFNGRQNDWDAIIPDFFADPNFGGIMLGEIEYATALCERTAVVIWGTAGIAGDAIE